MPQDITHFEFKSLHPMDHRQEYVVELLIKVERRFLWFKWVKSYRFIVPRQHLVIRQEMEWYLYGTKKKY
jgi:hypothetical protein